MPSGDKMLSAALGIFGPNFVPCLFIRYKNTSMLKKLPLTLGLVALMATATLSSCETEVQLTDQEVVDGLKEALRIGSENAVDTLMAPDGYFGDAAVKILFPDDAATVETTLRALPGGNTLCDQLILKLNRTAEDAADAAAPIFVNAIQNMTIEDGLAILHGSDDAATQYLQNQTRSQLYTEFKPEIEASLASVGANSAWTTVMDTYNAIPFHTPANADLPDYTTNKALDGVFNKLAGEELKIRKDVNARVTDLLKKVFGELD
jgi:hypothetical protein